MVACQTTDGVRQSAMIVGMVTRDILVFVDSHGSSVHLHSSYGGVLHSAIACMRNGIAVDLVSCLDDAALGMVSSLIGAVGLLDLSCVCLTSHPLPRCSLFWAPDVVEPVEQTTTSGVSIPHDHLLAVAKRKEAHGIYVNMTTGHDLDRRTLEKAALHGIRIYFDPHMLLYSVDTIGARFLHPPDDWRLWLAIGDVLQLNAAEFEAICNIANHPVEPFHESAVALMQELRELRRSASGPWGLIRTKKDCVDVVYYDGHQWYDQNRSVFAASVPHPAYSIGCGDSFGAGVFCGLLTSWDSHGLLSGLDTGIQWAMDKSRVLGLRLGQGGAI